MRLSARLVTLAAVAALPTKLAFAFTAEQVEAGRASYTQSCAACHGPELRNLPNAFLQGDEFIAKWRTRSTNDLLAQMRTTMPPESPGSLGEDAYLGVMAYILQRNGNAPGERRADCGRRRRSRPRRGAAAASNWIARERHRRGFPAGHRSGAA